MGPPKRLMSLPVRRPGPDAITIARRLERLSSVWQKDVFRLEPLAAGRLCLSRGPEGEACLVLVLDDSPAALRVNYKGISVQLFPEAAIDLEGNQSNCAIGVVRCREARHIHNFCVLAAELVELVATNGPAMATGRQLLDYIARWADVFASDGGLSTPKVVGLWGELEVLAGMPHLSRAMEAWHGPEAGKHDFAANKVCIEVKTTTMDVREHEFELEQLMPPSAGVDLHVASLLLRSDPAAGRTLDEQVDRVRRQLASDNLLDRKLARLGFIPGTAKDRYSLKAFDLFDAATISRPGQVDAARVRSVHFISNLVGLPALTTRGVRELRKRLCANRRV